MSVDWPAGTFCFALELLAAFAADPLASAAAPTAIATMRYFMSSLQLNVVRQQMGVGCVPASCGVETTQRACDPRANDSAS
jgi:hypothetical protein